MRRHNHKAALTHRHRHSHPVINVVKVSRQEKIEEAKVATNPATTTQTTNPVKQ
jgi:hypothetical protein